VYYVLKNFVNTEAGELRSELVLIRLEGIKRVPFLKVCNKQEVKAFLG